MIPLEHFQMRALPRRTAKDGSSWIPLVPREFVLRGTAYVVRVTGLRGSRVEVSPQAAHQCLTCPRSARIADLVERAPYGHGPLTAADRLPLGECAAEG